MFFWSLVLTVNNVEIVRNMKNISSIPKSYIADPPFTLVASRQE